MKQRIMNHASILVVLSVLLTFIAASTVMYGRLNNYMRQGVRDEALYIQAAMEQMGESFLTDEIGSLTSSLQTTATGRRSGRHLRMGKRRRSGIRRRFPSGPIITRCALRTARSCGWPGRRRVRCLRFSAALPFWEGW